MIMLAVIILNLVSLGYQVYNYKVLSIEKTLMPEKKLTLKNCTMVFTYLNILVCFANIYAYNVAVKLLMSIIMWVTICNNLIGFFCVLYLHSFAENYLRHQLNINVFAMEAVTFMLNEMFGTTNPINSTKEYVYKYKNGMYYFLITEAISIVLLSVIVITTMIRQFMKVHVPEEDEEAPEIKERMVINIPSIRSRPISVAA